MLSYLRWARDRSFVAAAFNFTPVPRSGYRIGVPRGGNWQEALNSDAECYGGSNVGNAGGVVADPLASHGQPFSLCLKLPPLGVLILRPA